MTTTDACIQIAQGIKVLVAAGITDDFADTMAAMELTPAGGTPERSAILAELRKDN